MGMTNFSNTELVELNSVELSEVEGGIIPFLIGVAVGCALAHYIKTH